MAILATEKVLTLDYWKPAGKLQVGDWVFDRNGKPVQIKLIQEYRAEECYEVTFDDWLTVSGDFNLGLPTENVKYRKRTYEYKGKFKFSRPLTRVTAQKLTEGPFRNHKNNLIYSVPTTKPLELPHQDLPVPPFIFGFWFFAGRYAKHIAPGRGKEEEVQQAFKEHGYKTKLHRLTSHNTRAFSVTPTIESQLIPNIPKQIPNNYLLGSTEQRIDLLRGIFCTKGRNYSPSKDRFMFSNRHFGTISRIQGVVESLGIKTKILRNEKLNFYSLIFRSRYKLVANQVSPPIRVHQARRYITNVTSIPGQSCIHIETDGQDNTILVGEGFISTC